MHLVQATQLEDGEVVVLRDLIRHDEKSRARERVDALLLEGLESGRPVPLTPDDWQEVREEVRARLARKRKSGG